MYEWILSVKKSWHNTLLFWIRLDHESKCNLLAHTECGYSRNHVSSSYYRLIKVAFDLGLQSSLILYIVSNLFSSSLIKVNPINMFKKRYHCTGVTWIYSNIIMVWERIDIREFVQIYKKAGFIWISPNTRNHIVCCLSVYVILTSF